MSHPSHGSIVMTVLLRRNVLRCALMGKPMFSVRLAFPRCKCSEYEGMRHKHKQNEACHMPSSILCSVVIHIADDDDDYTNGNGSIHSTGSMLTEPLLTRTYIFVLVIELHYNSLPNSNPISHNMNYISLLEFS